MIALISYIPILTTILSLVFFWIIFTHYREKPGRTYLLWWTIGVLCYGLGTFTESWVSVFGWSENIFKSWYITGALLGGAPLAQGSVHLLMKNKTANRLSFLLIVVILFAALAVVFSPVDTSLSETHRLSGAVLDWQWIRLITPFINLYAFIFLVGGAVFSATKYARQNGSRARMTGNIAIALGGLLPGIGGSFTKFGYTEVLYVTEFIGLCFIFYGYWVIREDRTDTVHQNQLSTG